MDSAILTNEALKLPAVERAHIIDTLWQSLDTTEQTPLDRAWLRESQDRLAAYHSGQIAADDGEETLRSIEASLKQ